MDKTTQISPTWSRTFTGVGFDIRNVYATEAQLEDVAHHLALLCRYGGATPVFYSVAQHATIAARAVLVATKSPALALLTLHHDDGEAYLYDIRRPHKGMTFLEDGAGIRHSFGSVEAVVLGWVLACVLPPQVVLLDDREDVRATVKDADDATLRAEYLGLFPDTAEPPDKGSSIRVPPVLPEDCQDWAVAKAGFLRMHYFLLREVAAAEERSRGLEGVAG